MPSDPQSIQNYIAAGLMASGTVAICTVLIRVQIGLEARVEKIMSDFLNRPERIKREADLIASETSRLSERAEETRSWVKSILKGCRHCPPADLSSTDAIRRDAA